MWRQFLLVVLVFFGVDWAFDDQPATADGKTHHHHARQPALDRQALATFALGLVGTPYRAQGKGPEGFDCSGYTGYVFRQFGIQLPASSRGQATIGHQVPEKSLAIGDLLFFGGPSSGAAQTIGHVGIVTEVGRNTVFFAHSTTHGGVMVDSLANPYYRERYITARRTQP